jgi:hypothetical protein
VRVAAGDVRAGLCFAVLDAWNSLLDEFLEFN